MASTARTPLRPGTTWLTLATYRLHDHVGNDLGLLERPARNLEPGDVVVLADGREALLTARVEAEPGPLAALLEVLIEPSSVVISP